jgi:hypothetical protein
MTDYIEADLRDPDAILASPQLRDTLDLSQPVAVMLVAILHFIPGDGQARPLVARLMDALPSGSYLAATHFTLDFMPEHEQATYRQMLDSGMTDIWPRDRAEFTGLFDGLELVDPGVALISEWRSDGAANSVDPSRIAIWGGVGRKP